MNQRWFRAGLQLGIMAVLVLVMSPWLGVVHLADAGTRMTFIRSWTKYLRPRWIPT